MRAAFSIEETASAMDRLASAAQAGVPPEAMWIYFDEAALHLRTQAAEIERLRSMVAMLRDDLSRLGDHPADVGPVAPTAATASPLAPPVAETVPDLLEKMERLLRSADPETAGPSSS